MAEAAVWFFYVHTAICGVYLCMVASFGWAWVRRNGVLAAIPKTHKVGPVRRIDDSTFMHAAGYVILGLYLVYAELYLYRVYLLTLP